MDGLLRAYITSDDGRQATTLYIRPGETIGIVALVAGPQPVTIQALTASRLLVLAGELLKTRAISDGATAWAIAQELAHVTDSVLEHLRVSVFGSIRQRVASHLLSLASTGDDGRLQAGIGHQAIADAVGTSREVVSRTLGELSRVGLVEANRGRIVILEPVALYNELPVVSRD